MNRSTTDQTSWTADAGSRNQYHRYIPYLLCSKLINLLVFSVTFCQFFFVPATAIQRARALAAKHNKSFTENKKHSNQNKLTHFIVYSFERKKIEFIPKNILHLHSDPLSAIHFALAARNIEMIRQKDAKRKYCCLSANSHRFGVGINQISQKKKLVWIDRRPTQLKANHSSLSTTTERHARNQNDYECFSMESRFLFIRTSRDHNKQFFKICEPDRWLPIKWILTCAGAISDHS